jgi:hypothetical protein
MLRKLLPLCLLSGAVTATQAQGPPGITFESAPPASPTAPAPAPATAPPAPPQPVPLTSADIRQVVDGVTEHLKQSYILPEMAEQLIKSIQAHQQLGDYDGLSGGPALASRLTADLQSVSRDRHLRVEYADFKLPPEEGGPSEQENQQYHKELDRTNCGFQRAEVLPGNIGYVQLNYFGAPDQCAATAAAAMKFVSHSDAIIFDMRQNHGGDPAMVALLASYLFDRPTHLDDLYNRHENKTTQYWATPDKVSDRMPTQPVYVLTSRWSFSGAEQFCYDLRNLRRATLIGEKTGGAAHPTRNRRINDHFLIAMPEYRYINFVTRTDWEGEGVTPDVPAAPWNALQIAQKLALDRVQHSDAQPALTTTAMR